MIYFILAVLFVVSCNGASKQRKRITKDQLAQLDFSTTDIDALRKTGLFKNGTASAACIASGSGRRASDLIDSEEQCPCIVDFGLGYLPCLECGYACYLVFGWDYSCCDGDLCCCYLEPGPCQREGVDCVDNCCT
eukprot:363965_1